MGPMEVASIGGHRYTFILTCDHSSHAWVVLLKNKSETLERFKAFVLMVERLTGLKIKFFHSDRGGEFMSHEFTKFLEEQGITRETSALRTPQQNGVAERMNQTLVNGAQSLLRHSGMSKGFWAEAINVAAHVLNRAPRKGVTFGFRRNPDVARDGRSEGRKRVRPIAIDYRTVAGTAGAGYKGDRRSKGPDSRSPSRTPTALRRHKGGET